MHRALFWLSLILLGIGGWLLMPTPAGDGEIVNTANPDAMPSSEPNYVGWAIFLLGFLTLACSHYLKTRRIGRADRVDARDSAHRTEPTEDAE